MQPVVVRGFAELRDAGITRTGYELHGLLFHIVSPLVTFALFLMALATHMNV